MKKYLLVFVVAVLILVAGKARSDQYYPFVKVDCNKAAQTFTISMPYLHKGENPEETLADIRDGKTRNMYYLIDIAKEPKKRVKCDLGKGKTVSFIGYFNGNHMANDNLGFRLNDMSLGSFFTSQYDDFLIKVLGSHEAIVRACPLSSDNKVKEDKCEIRHITKSNAKNSDTKIDLLRKIAGQGNAEAQYNLWNAYHNGAGVEKNDKKAINWLSKAADQGYIKAQLALGWAYYNGEGVEKNTKEAINWWHKAANQGNDEALAILNLQEK